MTTTEIAEPKPADPALWPILTIPAMMTVFAVLLLFQGRVAWCKCGSPIPWAMDIWSMHNSQHLFDPYSFTHMMHGVVFCGILWVLFSKWVPTPGRAPLAALIEGCWELLENSSFIIDKYRESTISLDYYGDSVANSMSDIVFCMIGFAIATRIGWKWSLLLFVATECILALWIRDNWTINLIMLIHPIDAIRDWQMAIAPH